MKAVENIAKEAIKAPVIDVKIAWVSSYKKLKLDAHVIAPVEPITIENFVIDTIRGFRTPRTTSIKKRFYILPRNLAIL